MKKFTIGLLITFALLIPFGAATLSDFYNKITGKPISEEVQLEINVSGGHAPTITVYETLMTDVSGGLNEGPLTTDITIKFEADDLEGIGNINDSSARIQFTKSGEDTRSAICTKVGAESSGTSTNYTCTVTMQFWDGAGTWIINASILDLNGNYAEDTSKTFAVGSTAGFVIYPTSVVWSEINPGATNQPALNSVTLNNTGNIQRNVEVNSTNLLGETDNTKSLLANDFSIDINSGCAGTGMNRFTFVQIVGATLPKGNYLLNDGTGQEIVYFCLNQASSDLTQQIYSTQGEGAWTVRIA
ncbi:hypothetical protein GW932_04395 [archaeon]|nr:hypothetical protein [archaeon]